MLGTLIGAFIIAVIRNGMNLMSVESSSQKIVLGAVLLLCASGAPRRLKCMATFSDGIGTGEGAVDARFRLLHQTPLLSW